MVKKLLIFLLFATAAIAAETRYYWDRPETTTLPPTARLLYYNNTGVHDFNITGANLNKQFVGSGGRAKFSSVSTPKLAITSTGTDFGVGYQTLQSLTNVNLENTAFGYRAGRAITSGTDNTTLGSSAGLNISTGARNTPVGSSALLYLLSGSGNTALGAFAGQWNADGSNHAVGNNSVYIGDNVRAGNNADTNSVVIGSYAVGKGPNTTVIGTSSTASAHIWGVLTGSDTSSGNTTIVSTSSIGTKGKIKFGDNAAYDEVQTRLGIGTQSPAAALDIVSTTGNGVNLSDLGYRAKGTATTWNDLRIEPTARTGAGTGTAPAFEQSFGTSGTGGVFSYTFAQTASALEYLYYALQMPHDWKEASAVKPHIHFSSPATSGTVKFKGICYGANYTGTFGAFGNWSSTTTLTGAAWKHNIAEGSPVSMTGKTVSTIMSCNVVRKAGDTAAAKAHVHYIDYHYEVDSLGSDTEYSKTATP